MMVKNREYFAFDDIETYIELRERYPNAHEVIWNRYTQDKQQGRLMFDFDFDDAWYGCKPKFVAPTFQSDVERLILETFATYYVGVDVKRFVFVWLISDVETKWSKHLIVKNAHFSDDWKMQTLIFYNLMLAIAEDSGFFRKYAVVFETDKMFDVQIARSNATMRMLHSTKLATEKKPNPKPLRLESPSDATFFDTLVQLYRREDVRNEQHINRACLLKSKLDQMLEDNREKMLANKFYKQVYRLFNVEVDKLQYEDDNRLLGHQEVETYFKIFEQHYCVEFGLQVQKCFRVRSVKGSVITLLRIAPGKCLISGEVHDSENAFLTVTADNSVFFHCFRGCDIDGKKSVKCYPPDYADLPVKEIVTKPADSVRQQLRMLI